MSDNMNLFFPTVDFYLKICPLTGRSIKSGLIECFDERLAKKERLGKSLDRKTLDKLLQGKTLAHVQSKM